MTSGGARMKSGAPPDPNSLRQDGKEWITLPERREGDVPEWPLDVGASAAERQMWEDIWTKAQAVMWEQQGQEREVALYVRKFIEAAVPKAGASIVNAQRAMADALGLTNPGLRFNRWKIGTDAEKGSEKGKLKTTASSRERFKVVEGGG